MKAAEFTRERILQATLELIWARSIGHMSMDMVCKEAGVSKSSLYHFFASKSELIVAALEYHWGNISKGYAIAFDMAKPGEDQLQAYVKITLEDLSRQKRETGKVRGCPYVLGAAEMSTLDEKIRALIENVFDRIIKLIERAIRSGISAGTFLKVDARTAARNFYMLMNGAVLQSKVRNSTDFIADVWPMMRHRLVR